MAACALLGAGLVAMPAHAAPVQVTLQVDAGANGATVASCGVWVPAGADGVAVLDAAVAGGCILQYQTQETAFGRYVTCIAYVCDAPTRLSGVTTGAEWATTMFWQMRVNGECTNYGVDDFEASSGAVLGFVYTSYAPSLADPSLFCLT